MLRKKGAKRPEFLVIIYLNINSSLTLVKSRKSSSRESTWTIFMYRSLDLTTHSNFLMPISLQPNIYLWFFKLRLFDLTECIVWNKKWYSLGFNDMGIKKIRVCGQDSIPFYCSGWQCFYLLSLFLHSLRNPILNIKFVKTQNFRAEAKGSYMRMPRWITRQRESLL